MINPKFNFTSVVHNVKKDIMDILRIQSMGPSGTYVGCPIVDQRRSKEDFNCPKSRMNRRLDSWKDRTFLAVGKIILTKSNLTCIS